MPVTADDAVEATLTDSSRFAAAHPEAWMRREKGIAVGYTGIPVAMFNGIIVERADADLDVASQMLDEIAATGLPYSVAVRSHDHVAFVELARSHGLTAKMTIPLMVLESPARIIEESLPDGLSVRELAPEEADEHAQLLASTFEMPIELARQMMVEETFRIEGVRSYVGEFGGRPVATALGMTFGDAVGILNVGTIEAARGRGFGRALTVRAIRDGVANGAKWSHLQASSAGFSVYRRLGFETVEEWSNYLPATAASSS